MILLALSVCTLFYTVFLDSMYKGNSKILIM